MIGIAIYTPIWYLYTILAAVVFWLLGFIGMLLTVVARQIISGISAIFEKHDEISVK